MRYLCIVYGCDGPDASAPDNRQGAVYQEVLANRQDLTERGHLIAASPLQGPETAMTVRVRENGMTVTDGPYAETKEQVGGFYLIDAVSMDAAVQLAATMPPARIGSIEVRPLLELIPD